MIEKNWIKNIDNLNYTSQKKIMLELINAMFNSVDTEKVITDSIRLEENILYIKEHMFNLNNFKRIKIVAIGKVASEAVCTLEKVLGDKVDSGVLIDIKEVKCNIVESFVGTHPKPSMINVKATEKIFELAEDIKKEDLVFIIVSGGGSALLCSSESEYTQGVKLYDNFLKSGGNIKEINLVRKHISILKGGGLAKLFYPASVVGLIFCDISGGHYEEVASGPTYKDMTTIDDAEKIIEKYQLGDFNLNETPKEDIYFEKVINISITSNVVALEAVAKKAKELGLSTKTISYQIFESAEVTNKNFLNVGSEFDVVIGGGEIKVEVKNDKGSGGRCLYLAMSILPSLKENQIFAAIASDGMDNCDSAGAIVNIDTYKKSKELNLDLNEYIQNFDAYNFFEKTEGMVFTGPTGI
ncbi:MAG: DUF4147 domain-containing protein, partial [Patescibacteria group bacterium]